MRVTYIFEIVDDGEVKHVWLRYDVGLAPAKSNAILIRVRRRPMSSNGASALID